MKTAFGVAALLGLTLGMASACGNDGATSPSANPPGAKAAGGSTVDVSQIQVQSAEVSSDGFCFFVLGPPLPFGGYSGAGQRVDAASGQTNYQCKTDLLFGSPVTQAVQIRDVQFHDFFLGVFQPCDIYIAPGEQAMVQCHE
ncbi:MAG TPA: hypothetical protein VNH46_04930 [Gemmatimonadales bacterium]|nr:hypothetical protein [Gemmatimonadales bacterium]